MARPRPPLIGLMTGLGVTMRQLFRKTVTVQYPIEKEELVPRARGVISLDSEACTVCMLCARECPDWCIYIEGHKEKVPPKTPGGRERTRALLDHFDIDYALCMYCGICVEVCPFDALFWSPNFDYVERDIGKLLHPEKKLNDWLTTRPEYPKVEAGAQTDGKWPR